MDGLGVVCARFLLGNFPVRRYLRDSKILSQIRLVSARHFEKYPV